LKCCGAKVILDGFASIGGTTLKLASLYSCVKTIANDKDAKKLNLLLNNAKVYEVDSNIEISEQNFLQI
jgi:16S rRNA C967 or C1407 C5-methylase (RsmB/RsmF family)